MKILQFRKEQLIADLQEVGVVLGDHVAVGLSFKSIGNVAGGPDTLIDALLETVGPEGTIMMNTFSANFPPNKVQKDLIFDPSTAVPITGVVPRTILKRKGAFRSRHPICSVAAIGRYASYLTEDHNEESNAFLPYDRLAKIDGKLLAIGIDDRMVVVRHVAQQKAGLWLVPMLTAVRYFDKEGRPRIFVMKEPPCVAALPKMVPTLVEMGIVERGRVGNAQCFLAPVNASIKAMTALLKNDPTLTLCKNVFCTQCRELERKMNLYNRIQNPRLFQRNLIFRKIINLRNLLALEKRNKVKYISPPKAHQTLGLFFKAAMSCLERASHLKTRKRKQREVSTKLSGAYESKRI